MTEKLEQANGRAMRCSWCRHFIRIATWRIRLQSGAIKAWLCPDHVREYREKLAEKGGAR